MKVLVTVFDVIIPVGICIGLYLLGEKKRSSFIVLSILQFLIIARSIMDKSWGIIVMCVVYVAFNIWSFVKWGKEEKGQNK